MSVSPEDPDPNAHRDRAHVPALRPIEFQIEAYIDAEPIRLTVPCLYRAAPTATHADTILLLHGLGCAKESFRGVFADHEQSLKRYTLIAPDLPGFGAATPPGFDPRLATMELYTAVCAALIEQVGKMKTTNLHIVGHSMGGAVAVLLADRLCSRSGDDAPYLRSLVSVEGNLIAEDCGLLSQRIAAVDETVFRTDILPELEAQYCSADRPLPRLLCRWLRRADPGAFYHSAVSLVGWSTSGRLLERFTALADQITVAYIHGARNDTLPIIEPLRACGIACHATPGGHFTMIDAPAAFSAVLDRTITSTSTARP